jgi:hypothetical protein
MPHAHPPDQGPNGVRVEDIANHAIRLALVEAALGAAGDDAARILTAVLEEREPLADLGGSVDGRVGEQEPKHTAHCTRTLVLRRARVDGRGTHSLRRAAVEARPWGKGE